MINIKLLPTYPYILQQTSNKNIQTYHIEAAILIKHKVLITNLQGNVQQLQGRIDNQILRVKGFLLHFDVFFDVLLNQPIAAWNLFALYITKKAKCC